MDNTTELLTLIYFIKYDVQANKFQVSSAHVVMSQQNTCIVIKLSTVFPDTKKGPLEFLFHSNFLYARFLSIVFQTNTATFSEICVFYNILNCIS